MPKILLKIKQKLVGISFFLLIFMVLQLGFSIISQATDLRQLEISTPTACTGLTDALAAQQDRLNQLYKSDRAQFQQYLAEVSLG